MATPSYDPYLYLWHILFDGTLLRPPKEALTQDRRNTIAGIVGAVTENRMWPADTTFLERFKNQRKQKVGHRRLGKKESELVQGLLECLNPYQPHSPYTDPGARLNPGLWDHFKGGVYLLESLASWTSGDDEQVVIYTSLLTGSKYVRLVSQWCEVVQWPDGKYRSRFVYRGPPGTVEPSYKVPSPT
jgi:hypothetical protein